MVAELNQILNRLDNCRKCHALFNDNIRNNALEMLIHSISTKLHVHTFIYDTLSDINKAHRAHTEIPADIVNPETAHMDFSDSPIQSPIYLALLTKISVFHASGNKVDFKGGINGLRAFMANDPGSATETEKAEFLKYVNRLFK